VPTLSLENVTLNYRVDGADDAPPLLMSNSLGTDLEMWSPQMDVLTENFRVIRYDTRGHGVSSRPEGPYTIEQLGCDALAVVDAVHVERAHFIGLSMGGLQGVARIRRMLVETSSAGYAANCAAIRDADLRAGLATIRTPTLVIAGTHDPSTPPALGREIADAMPDARYIELDSAHLSNIEQAGAFNAAVVHFLTDGLVTENSRRTIGETMRRSVLGDAHVDRGIASRTDFNGEFIDTITRTAWGETWTRPGLPRHTRSLLTIAMTVALNRPDELRLHLNAARNNGVTRNDIKEVLMQAAVYCGVPAANSAFHLATQVFAEQDKDAQ